MHIQGFLRGVIILQSMNFTISFKLSQTLAKCIETNHRFMFYVSFVYFSRYRNEIHFDTKGVCILGHTPRSFSTIFTGTGGNPYSFAPHRHLLLWTVCTTFKFVPHRAAGVFSQNSITHVRCTELFDCVRAYSKAQTPFLLQWMLFLYLKWKHMKHQIWYFELFLLILLKVKAFQKQNWSS